MRFFVLIQIPQVLHVYVHYNDVSQVLHTESYKALKKYD